MTFEDNHGHVTIQTSAAYLGGNMGEAWQSHLVFMGVMGYGPESPEYKAASMAVASVYMSIGRSLFEGRDWEAASKAKCDFLRLAGMQCGASNHPFVHAHSMAIDEFFLETLEQTAARKDAEQV
jgi:hypothetical protein